MKFVLTIITLVGAFTSFAKADMISIGCGKNAWNSDKAAEVQFSSESVTPFSKEDLKYVGLSLNGKEISEDPKTKEPLISIAPIKTGSDLTGYVITEKKPENPNKTYRQFIFTKVGSCQGERPGPTLKIYQVGGEKGRILLKEFNDCACDVD